jgi:hypothetical protein
LGYPEYLGVLAQGLVEIGLITEAFIETNQALEIADRYGERWCVAELLRIQGELLMIRAGGDQSVLAAQDCFHAALDLARQQRALSWKLRCA